ncbi:unnamed protein product, partial [Musa acuminata subsp. burmannicoides]
MPFSLPPPSSLCSAAHGCLLPQQGRLRGKPLAADTLLPSVALRYATPPMAVQLCPRLLPPSARAPPWRPTAPTATGKGGRQGRGREEENGEGGEWGREGRKGWGLAARRRH